MTARLRIHPNAGVGGLNTRHLGDNTARNELQDNDVINTYIYGNVSAVHCVRLLVDVTRLQHPSAACCLHAAVAPE